MPYANNEGIRIHYEIEGDGPPLVLLHGLTGNLEGFENAGWVDGLKDRYRLILIDARGHGSSDKPHDPEAHRMALRAADVVAVLDDLDIPKAHFLGYSMGAWTGFGISKYAPERFHSLILGGSVARDLAPDEPRPFVELFQQGMEAVVEEFEPLFGRWWTPEVEASTRANDLEALIASESVIERVGYDSFLPSVTLPCLLYGGADDPFFSSAEACAERMPNATFVSLPGLDHLDAFYRSDLVLPHVKAFLESVEAGLA